jgi:molybdenum cofactor cytidylyltransferase
MTSTLPSSTAIILAAGASSRLGQSKQLAEFEGVPLLLKTVLAALDAGIPHVLVVLGANHLQHQAILAHLPVEIVINQEWEAGMGRSLKCGVKSVISARPQTCCVAVLVCDQPFLSAGHIRQLFQQHDKSKKPIVASAYNNTHGVPCLFEKSLFSELLNLPDPGGAKFLIQKFPEKVTFIEWPDGKTDIDTPADLENLKD